MSAPAEDANATPPASETLATSDTSRSGDNGTFGGSRGGRVRGRGYWQRNTRTGSSTAMMLISKFKENMPKVGAVIGTNAKNRCVSFNMLQNSEQNML